MQTVPSKTDKIVSLINEFKALRAARQEQRLRQMADFLMVFERQPPVDNFNVFSLLGIGTDEVKHSNFLAWLLDAKADHGQGNIFLKALVESCSLNIPPNALNQYTVRTELPRHESIIDIMIGRRAEFLIYLENKIFAQEGPAQIDREFRDMQRLGAALHIPAERMFAIFLTPAGHPPLSGDATRWRALSYQELATAFEKLLLQLTSAKMKYILEDWLKTISTW